MSAAVQARAAARLLLSGNEAVARGVWEAGARVATAYPGTPATEMLETLALYPDLHAEWSVNEKVALEVAIGASMAGARAFCAMKHVGLNVAADPFMTLTLTGTVGGLVVAVADDVGMSSSQNEQDSRVWGRFAHVPVLEPADSQEAYLLVREAFEISERFGTPVLLRLTTRVCHVKALVTVGECAAHPAAGFVLDPARWVMVPGNARRRLPLVFERERALAAFSDETALNILEPGTDRRLGFITSGPAWLHLREVFPDSPVLKLGLSHPLPLAKVRALAAEAERLVVVEETEPLLETELRAAGFTVHGKDVLPRIHELTPDVLEPALRGLLGETVAPAPAAVGTGPFPRPPTLCAACPHLGVFHALSHLRKKVIIAGDIGCYTLGAGHPWHALDSCISMGASMGVALGLDKARGDADRGKGVLAVIGDSTFLHMGMQGLLDIVYNRSNVTVLILDNRTTGMTGGQPHPGTGRDVHGETAPRVDFAKLAEALGVRPERIKVVDTYALPTLFRTIRDEIKAPEPSVVITTRPCTLIDSYERHAAFRVLDERCTGCGNCMDVGCPAITVTRRGQETKKSGQVVELTFTTIDGASCTGCAMCVETCGAEAIVPLAPREPAHAWP